MTVASTTFDFDTARSIELGDALADVVVIVDRHGVICWANRAAARLTSSRVEDWVGRPGLELVHPDDRALAALSLVTVVEKEAGTPIELRIRVAAGWRLMETIGSNLDDEHIVLVLRDVTDRRRWEIASDDVARCRAVLQHAATLTVLVDAGGRVVASSAALSRALGRDPEAIAGRPFAELVAADDCVEVEAAFERSAAQPVERLPVLVEAQLRTQSGDAVPFELGIVGLLDDPTVEGFVVSAHDISRLRRAQEQLAVLARHDPVTGLLNRRSFDDEVAREWRFTRRHGVDSWVVVVDLDGFKQVNDDLGHAAGDRLLCDVARALEASGRTTDVCGRLGGDEFGVLLVRCGERAAAAFARRLEEELAARRCPGGAVVRASVGYESLRAAPSATAAVDAADRRMLAAKRAARGAI
jgi:diguanylate cyclase (GGDEF)-like protein/PAS domain S-box-containing protein